MDESKAPPPSATMGMDKGKGKGTSESESKSKSTIPPPPASFALLRDHVDWEGHVLKTVLVDDWLTPYEMLEVLAGDLLPEDVPATTRAALEEAVDAAWAFRCTPAGRGDVRKPNLAQLIPTLQREFGEAAISVHEFLSIREAERCFEAQADSAESAAASASALASESTQPLPPPSRPRPFLFMSRNDLLDATVQELLDDRVEVYFGASAPSADYDELMESFRYLLVTHGFDVAPYTDGDLLLTVRNVHWRGVLGYHQSCVDGDTVGRRPLRGGMRVDVGVGCNTTDARAPER